MSAEGDAVRGTVIAAPASHLAGNPHVRDPEGVYRTTSPTNTTSPYASLPAAVMESRADAEWRMVQNVADISADGAMSPVHVPPPFVSPVSVPPAAGDARRRGSEQQLASAWPPDTAPKPAERVSSCRSSRGDGEGECGGAWAWPPECFPYALRRLCGTQTWLTTALRPQPGTSISMRVAADALLNVTPRALGQVVLCNSSFAGAVIFVSISIAEGWQYMLLCLAGVWVSTAAAVALAQKEAHVRAGLFGYNGALVGCAVATFFADVKPAGGAAADPCGAASAGHGVGVPTGRAEGLLGALLATAVGAVAATLVTAVLAVSLRPRPVMTLPFNAAAMLLLLALSRTGANYPQWPPAPPAAAAAAPPPPTGYHSAWRGPCAYFGGTGAAAAGELLLGLPRGYAQVYLCGNAWSGVAVLGAMFCCDPPTAATSLLGACAGWATALWAGAPAAYVASGLAGYNGLLAAASAACVHRPLRAAAPRLAVTGAAAAVGAELLAHALAVLFRPAGLPVLTLPFCVAALAAHCAADTLASRFGGEERMKQLLKLMHTANDPAAEAQREREVESLRAAFDVFDTDGSGSIDGDELRRAFRRFGQHLTHADVQELMDMADKDGNGEIDFDEFCALFHVM